MLADRLLKEGYAALAEDFEERFSSYLVPTNTSNPPDGVPAHACQYFPHTSFPGIWPVLGASELPPSGGTPNLGVESNLRVGTLRTGVRIYHPSLTVPNMGDDYKDGREAAKRITRMVMSNWLKALAKDTELGPYGVALSFDMGDHDRIGNPFYQPGTGGRTVLWVLAITAEIPL